MFFPFSSRFLAILFLMMGLSFSSVQAEKEAKPADRAAKKEEPKADSGKAKASPKSDKKALPKAEAKQEEKQAPKAVPNKKKEAPAKDNAAEEKTHVVKEAPFFVKTKLPGIVESIHQTPVAVVPKRWTDLLVIKAVAHGTEVKEGSALIELDRDSLERKIRETKAGMPTKELELAALELELDKLEKSTPLTLESSRKSKMQAEEDLAYYEDVTRPMRERDARENVKQIEEYLAYAEEELKQLKKMYDADDLTEETEEIILRRAQNSVDEYKWMLEQTKSRSDRSLSTTIPREHERMERSLELQQITWRAGEKATRDALEKKRLEVKAKQYELEEAHRALEEYEEDSEALTVRAPHAGIVYYGMNQRGKWTTGATVEKKLIPGGKLTSREIVMTIADPAKVQLRLAVAEDKLKGLEAGRDASIVLKRDSDAKLAGKVQEVARVPYSDGTYNAVVSIGKGKNVAVLPGMNAEAEVTVYENKKALTVPKIAIKKDGDKETVTLKGGKVVSITSGRTQGANVEILKGLTAGDEVVLPAAPKPAAPAATAAKK